MKTQKTFFKFCNDCGVKYNPTGKENYYCEKCLEVRAEKRRINQRKTLEKKKNDRT
jgi:tRNA(Ile2) C34 agmatinyltransferase TiaS